MSIYKLKYPAACGGDPLFPFGDIPPRLRRKDHLRDPKRAGRVRHWGSLRDQDIHMAQLGNDLFGGMSLLAHRDPPWLKTHTSAWTTPRGMREAIDAIGCKIRRH